MTVILEGKSAKERKEYPLYSGLLMYFPDACLAVAHLSFVANEQHNPGEQMHWSRGKSNDHHDTAGRHLLDAGTVDTDGELHSVKLAWRALAIAQLEIEQRAKAAETLTRAQSIPPGLGMRWFRNGDTSTGYSTRIGLKDRRICFSESKRMERCHTLPGSAMLGERLVQRRK